MTLHEKLLTLVKTERKITSDVLSLINEAEALKLHLDRGHSSMFVYLTKELGYSEGSANRRLQSARLLKSTPGLSESLKAGELNLSQASLLQSAIRQQQKIIPVSKTQKEILINSLKGQTQIQTKRLIQEALPLVKFDSEKSSVRPQGKTLISFEVTKEELELIEKAKSILSHTCPSQQTKDVLLKLCNKLIHSKTAPKEYKKTDQTQEGPGKDHTPSEEIRKTAQTKAPQISSAREFIPAQLKRRIFEKANHQCEFKSSVTGQHCHSRSFLEIDHIQPVALGGTSAPENLRVLCRNHNQYMAERAGLGRI